MDNQKEDCEKLIKKWRELKAKLPRAQRIIPGKPFEPPYISSEERNELNEITEKLKNKYIDSKFLSKREKYEIEEQLK
jgi:hypothetical protein